MIAYMMLYAAAVGLPILLAATACSAALRRYGRPERGLWLVALGLALTLPVAFLMNPFGATSAAAPGTILTEMPEGAEVIAIVKASSDSGWTQQDSLDYAVDELKKQAAKVGANAVVLTGRDTSSQTVGVPVYGGGTVISSSEVEIVQGIAVWVD